MKHLLYPLIILFLLASCQQEDLPSADGVGYLSLEDITIQTANVVTTRAVDEDLYVEISSDEVNHSYNPGATPSKIDLPAGTYTLKAYNAAFENYQSWGNEDKGEAVYSLTTTFEVEAGKVNYFKAEVPMINFGVRLELPEGFDTAFPKNSFSVTVGNRTVSLNDGETAYFPHSESVSVSYTLSVTNTETEENDKTGSNNEWENATIQPGTVYVITYDYATESLSLLAN